MEELQFVWGWQPALYLFLGGAFLFSAYSLWKRDKDNRR